MSGQHNPVITMVDYGGSNLRSVQKAFEAVDIQVRVTDEPEDVRRADRIVLPGVGAFKAGMDGLRARGLDNSLRAAVTSGIPILGICLGMQLLFDESEEMGRHDGLGLLSGRVLKFTPISSQDGGRPLKVPHMGWNQINHDRQHPLLTGVPSDSHAYFVHSYYCAPDNPADIMATAEYGRRFAAIVGRGHIMGIQFHPEKSQSIGLRILHNFATMEMS